jgi:predicted cupin superfamily sugar epimerase
MEMSEYWTLDACSPKLSVFDTCQTVALRKRVRCSPDTRVRLHRIRNDQLYHYYLGYPIEVLMLRADGTSGRAIVGHDLRSGQRVQLLIPGNTFHTARIIGGRRWFLGASTEWPGVEPADVEIGDVDALAEKYPGAASDLRAFQQGRGD